MTMTDPIADMLTRIRNGQRRGLFTISSPYSKFRAAVLEVLKKEGYIREYSKVENKDGKPELIIELKYMDGEPVIKEIKKESTPGCRNYSKISDLPKIYNGLGIAIISTSRGVLSDFDARRLNVGGEVICIVF